MLQLLKTKDNSFTLYNPHLDETYHSRHGALMESQYVFIKQGLQHYIEKTTPGEIRILEVGFGTGLNALLTLLEFEKHNITVRYDSLEPFPVAEDIISQLDYANLLHLNEEQKNNFRQMHEGKLHVHKNASAFQFNLIKTGLMETVPETTYDLVYFDAFAPGKQPEMWAIDVFRKCYELLNAGGIMVTYCAKGEVKRNLKSAGFVIETLPGPPGKREMTRAIKL